MVAEPTIIGVAHNQDSGTAEMVFPRAFDQLEQVLSAAGRDGKKKKIIH